MNHLKFFLASAIYLGLFACSAPSNSPEKKPLPNIIYVLADDLGYGDLSCLNERSKIQTPHLDLLAEQGIHFTDAHSGSAVCTPTRYGILTGRYAWRSRLKNGVTWSYDKHLIDTERYTVPDLLRENGYHTACIGKWHLGLDWAMDNTDTPDFLQPIQNGPNALGFDYFYGITASLDIPPYFYIENDRITATSIDTIDGVSGKKFWRKGPIGNDFKHIEVMPKFTEKAIAYINERAQEEKPFFLYFPLAAPHTPILPTPEFQGKSKSNEYGDFVLMVDDVIGQLSSALEKNGLSENTIVIFTSDNGCSPMADFEELEAVGHDPSYIYRGHKADIFEGGHRIPFILRWPAKVKPNTSSDETICLTDLMATCAGIVGNNLPEDAGEDSYSFLSILSGESYPSPLREATVHHSINGSFALRQGKWKLNFCPGSGGWSDPRPEKAKKEGLPLLQLYNVETDPGEEQNLADQYPQVVEDLTKLLTQYVENGRSTPGQPQSNEGEITFLPQADEK